jgi:hypothetical protein
MVNVRPKMNGLNTYRKPILLYCDQATQTQEAEDPGSDVPPCQIGSSRPLIFPDYSPPPTRYVRGLRAAAILQQPITISSEEESFPTQRHQRLNTGLGQSNVVNTVGATATISHTKVISIYFLQVAMLTMNGNHRVIPLFKKSAH